MNKMGMRRTKVLPTTWGLDGPLSHHDSLSEALSSQAHTSLTRSDPRVPPPASPRARVGETRFAGPAPLPWTEREGALSTSRCKP